jgi:hypothetical protein
MTTLEISQAPKITPFLLQTQEYSKRNIYQVPKFSINILKRKIFFKKETKKRHKTFNSANQKKSLNMKINSLLK